MSDEPQNETAPAAPTTQEVPPPEGGEQPQEPGKSVSAVIDAGTGTVLRLELDAFEGPFEVLLYLIRAQEIDVFDIPILQVTEQYLQFLDLLREENLDLAGEFLVMAATLIQIKARMIIPADVEEDDEEIEEEDPRLELVEKLLEYRRYRDLAEALGDLEERRQGWFARSVKPKIEAEEEEEEYFEVSLYDLVKAIRGVLRFLTEGPIHEVEAESHSVDEKVGEISNLLEEHQSVTWTDLFQRCRSRAEAVCFLLAILELCRMGRVRAHQHRSFGDIRLFPRTPESEPAGEAVPDAV